MADRKFIESVRTINQEIFTVSLLTYLVFYLIEDQLHGFISGQFNINILLGIVIISGMLMKEPEIQDESTGPRWSLGMIVFIISLGFLSTAIILVKTVSLGWLSLPLSILGGATTTILSFVTMINGHKQ